MTMTIKDEILRALDYDVPRMTGDIADDVGRENNNVSAQLSLLQKAGQARRTPDGWIRTSTPPDPPAPPFVVHEASASVEAPAPKKRGRKPKAEHRGKGWDAVPAKHTPATPDVAAPSPPRKPKPPNGATQREATFAIGEDGSILFKIIAGKRTGELGSINHLDAMALFRLMESVDWIRENA